MKRIIPFLILLAAIVPLRSAAQYYQIANQLQQVITPALSGSLNYKGFVEMSGLAGLGHNRANVIDFSTTQGFQYSSWFFMGVGLGVDVVMAQQPEGWTPDPDYGYMSRSNAQTKVMIPVFSDFRFNIGDRATTSFFIDIKLGAAWLMGSDYLRMADGFLSNSTQFYMRPTVGLRIPVSRERPDNAVNVGLTYQLITSNNNYYWSSRSLSLNNLGLSVAYEW
ncbi:MAG: hypothetical protein J6C95_00065 [Muribaculaceae bacterium]|nr:hypothetical protein [Muribaculaceae bacterium]